MGGPINPARHRTIDIIFYSLVFGGRLIISVVMSVVHEYVPVNTIEDNYNIPANDLSILLFRTDGSAQLMAEMSKKWLNLNARL